MNPVATCRQHRVCWQQQAGCEGSGVAEGMGLQMQQLQHLQTVVVTVRAWGDFCSYLNAAQAARCSNAAQVCRIWVQQAGCEGLRGVRAWLA